MEKNNISTEIAGDFDYKLLGFTKPVIFTHDKIGFSTTKKLNDKIQKKLKITEEKPYTSLIHFSIDDERVQSGSRAPIYMRAAFVYKRDDVYVFDDKYIKNSKVKPLDVISSDEYYYDLHEKTYYKKNNKVDLDNIISDFYRGHIKTTKPIRGFYLRWKLLLWRKIIPTPFAVILFLIQQAYQILSGNKIYTGFLSSQTTVEKNITLGKKFVFYGYEASQQTIFIYSLIHLISYTFIFFYFDPTPKYIRLIAENSFLIIIYVIVSLTFFDKAMPKILEFIYQKVNNLYVNVKFKRIKVY